MGHDYATRTKRIRSLLAEAGIDALVASVGADLPYLTGYEALLTERLTMLVLPVDGESVLVVPRTGGAPSRSPPRGVRDSALGRDR